MLQNLQPWILRRLQIRELLLLDHIAIGEALGPGEVILVEALGKLVGETLGQLVEENLVLGIHGAVTTLKPGKVLVRWKGIQNCDSRHESTRRGEELRDSEKSE